MRYDGSLIVCGLKRDEVQLDRALVNRTVVAKKRDD